MENGLNITKLEFNNLVFKLAASVAFDTIYVVSRRRQRALQSQARIVKIRVVFLHRLMVELRCVREPLNRPQPSWAVTILFEGQLLLHVPVVRHGKRRRSLHVR